MFGHRLWARGLGMKVRIQQFTYYVYNAFYTSVRVNSTAVTASGISYRLSLKIQLWGRQDIKLLTYKDE